MKIAVLSTDTLHHNYFINKLLERLDIVSVFFEAKRAKFAFDTSSPFANDEESFENKMFLKERYGALPKGLGLHEVSDVNDSECINKIKKYKPEIGISFGTGKIKPQVFSLFKNGILNIHRGIVTRYRGLDSDLWAIYKDDFYNIGVSIHYVEESLDSGAILKMERIDFSKTDKIFHLRYKTTRLALEMMADILSNFEDYRKNPVLQIKKGPYYSAMPSGLKPVCQDKFSRFIKKEFNAS